MSKSAEKNFNDGNKSSREKFRKKEKRCWGTRDAARDVEDVEDSVRAKGFHPKGWTMRRVLKPFATRDSTRPLNQLSQCSLVLSVFPSANDTLSRSNASQRVIISKSSEVQASLLLSLPSYHVEATLLRNIFYTTLHALGKRTRILFSLFSTLRYIGARLTVRQIVFIF